ncbi:MAG: GntR family transcriptional regulator, partial [Kiritimatiellales bacterium]
YEARELLEVFAAEKAAYLASRRDVEIMRHFVETQHALCRKLRDSSEETLSGDDVTAWLEADVGFHMAMLKAAGNPVILKMVRECHIMSRLLGNFRHILSLRQISRTWLHHSRILRALRLKNPGRAAISMRLHIQFSFRTALMHFDSAMADGFPPYTHRTVEFVEQGKPQ